MMPPLTRTDVAAAAAGMGIRDPADPAALLTLLRGLYAIGRRDLPLGRLVEGHVDAVQIATRLGTPAQRERVRAAVAAGRVFGVWNADPPAAALTLADGRLTGGKAYASGAGLVTDALVSVDAAGGRQLLWLDLNAVPPAIDRGWWRVTGMQRSETHLAAWDAALPADAPLGAPSDYLREPWFGGGALRFAAVQAGGIAGIVDGVRDHLVATARADDPVQSGRLADLYGAAQAAAGAVRDAAAAWSNDTADATVAHVAAARAAVYRAGEDALRLAAAAVGLAAMFEGHPLSARLRDLDVYLRQPAPDMQRLRCGRAVAGGLLRASL